jgi:hypothetical protein
MRLAHRMGAPAPGRCRQMQINGGTERSTARARGRTGGTPKPAADAKPISRGGTRATQPERARTGGAKSPDPLAVKRMNAEQRLWLRLGATESLFRRSLIAIG